MTRVIAAESAGRRVNGTQAPPTGKRPWFTPVSIGGDMNIEQRIAVAAGWLRKHPQTNRAKEVLPTLPLLTAKFRLTGLQAAKAIKQSKAAHLYACRRDSPMVGPLGGGAWRIED